MTFDEINALMNSAACIDSCSPAGMQLGVVVSQVASITYPDQRDNLTTDEGDNLTDDSGNTLTT